MKLNRNSLLCAALAITASLALAPAAIAAKLGETLPAIELKDQLGKAHTLDATVRRIYANADRKGDALMKAAMEKLDQTRLDAQQAVVIADISAAPGFVKAIIKSSLKDRRYNTWIDLTGSTQRKLPYKPDQVTVIELEQLRITAIRYISDAESLKREFAQPLK